MNRSPRIFARSVNPLLSKYGIVFILIGICLLMTVLSPAFATVRNLTNVIRQVSVIGILAIGVTFTIISGGIDLSSGSLLAFVGVIVASLVQSPEAPERRLAFVLPLAVAFLVGLLVGGGLGGITGVTHAYGKVPAFIATLGMMTVARGAALLYAQGRPIGYLKPSMAAIGRESFLGLSYPIWTYLFVGVISWILLTRSRFGRYVYAIGGNSQAARMCGINVEWTLVKVYAYAGMLSAVSGILLISRTAAGNPTYGVAYELDAIAATVIGGTSLSGGVGSIPLCIVGALIIGVINNSMDLLSVDAYWQQVVKGSIIVLAVFLDARKRRKR